MKQMYYQRILYVLLVLYLLAGCTTQPLESLEQEKLIPVQVEKVKQDTFIHTLELSGRTKSKQEFPLFAPAPLSVEEVYVHLGQEIKQGDQLLRFENPELEVQLHEAEKQVELNKKTLQLLEESRKELEQKQAQYRVQMNESMARAEALLAGAETGAVTMLDLLEASTQLLFLQSQLQFFEGSNTFNNLQSLPGSVQEDQAMLYLRSLQEAKKRLTIYAPFDGVITLKNITAHEIAIPNTPLLQLSNLEQIIVQLNLGSTQITQVREGAKAQIWFEGINEPRAAAVESVSLGVSWPGNYYQAEIILNNQDKTILPGQFVKAEVETKSIPDALLVPIEAVSFVDNQAFVYLLKKEQAIRQDITIGQRNRHYYHVLEGLNQGDLVVTLGKERIAPGSKVYIQK